MMPSSPETTPHPHHAPVRNLAIWYRRFGDPEQVLQLEQAPLAPVGAAELRVRMLYAPVNASDLIPVTGAYGHRVIPPQVAGYEGVGIVTDAPAAYRRLLGKRVLPLRGQGTWQSVVACEPQWAIPVPDAIDDPLAARGYINPLAALLMLKQHPPAGKHLLLTAAGSDCALLLGQWALRQGALSVSGVHRSPAHAPRLAACGITPIRQTDSAAIVRAAACADLVFDATGGELAQALLAALPAHADFVCYGLLSGRPFHQLQPLPRVHWFHIRNTLGAITGPQWQALFGDIWPLLASSIISASRHVALADWQQAIRLYSQGGRAVRPLLVMPPLLLP